MDTLIHHGREILRIGKTLQRFAPGALMRGRAQDAVDVENGRGQRRRRVRSGFHWFGSDHGACNTLAIDSPDRFVQNKKNQVTLCIVTAPPAPWCPLSNRQYISVVAANISFFSVATGSEASVDE